MGWKADSLSLLPFDGDFLRVAQPLAHHLENLSRYSKILDTKKKKLKNLHKPEVLFNFAEDKLHLRSDNKMKHRHYINA